MKKYKLAVFIGRITPCHNGHVENIIEGSKIADKVLILLGSPNVPLSPTNPFSVDARRRIIDAALKDVGIDYIVDSILDTVTMDEWLAFVKEAIMKYEQSDSVVFVGCDRDSSTYYITALKSLHDVHTIDPIRVTELSATSVRAALHKGDTAFVKDNVPAGAFDVIMSEYQQVEKLVSQDITACASYRAKRSKYPVIDVAADALVICDGHVALIVRGSYPGKGLLALPGGFLEPSEEWEDGAKREMYEETGYSISAPCITSKVFSSPNRSSRSRIITQVFMYEIPLDEKGQKPSIVGLDDASNAVWFPIESLVNPCSKTMFFEDHFTMINECLRRVDYKIETK